MASRSESLTPPAKAARIPNPAARGVYSFVAWTMTTFRNMESVHVQVAMWGGTSIAPASSTSI